MDFDQFCAYLLTNAMSMGIYTYIYRHRHSWITRSEIVEGFYNGAVSPDEPLIIPSEPEERSQLLQTLGDWPRSEGFDYSLSR